MSADPATETVAYRDAKPTGSLPNQTALAYGEAGRLLKDLHLGPQPELSQCSLESPWGQLIVSLLPSSQVGSMIVDIIRDGSADSVWRRRRQQELIRLRHAQQSPYGRML